jgi:hypothetical protein
MSASATLSLGYVGIYVTPWVANFIEQPAGAVVAVAALPSGKSMGDGWGVIAVGGLLFACCRGNRGLDVACARCRSLARDAYRYGE